MTVQSQLRIRNRGVATVYLSLPLARAENGFPVACAALERGAIQELIHGSVRRPADATFLLLTGQADFAARVEVNDFRTILEMNYPPENTSAFVYNWVFSSIYEDNDLAASIQPHIPVKGDATPAQFAAAQGSDVSIDEPVLRFIVHARVLRSVYVSQPREVENALVAQIRKLFHGIRISIETGIGWSDLIISGDVQAHQFSDLLNRLIDLNTFSGGRSVSEAIPLFTRTLTLFGYDANSDPLRVPRISDGDAQALIFVRSVPGRVRDAQELLKRSFNDISVHVVDGKLDLVGHVGVLTADFFPSHSAIAEGTQGASCIHKLETHLLFGATSKQPVNNALILPYLQLQKCRCDEALRELNPTQMSRGLEDAVHNIRFLFQTSLGDATSCCDVRPAILACHEGLLTRLISRLNTARGDLDRLASALNQRRFIDVHEEEVQELQTAVVAKCQKDIETWVLTCERVLRQRSVGSFDEFLGQSDRALFYRGGAQKMLFLADCLMNEFYSRSATTTRPQLAEDTTIGPVPFVFASLYDAVERIESVVGAGMIRIPARNVFKLAAVVPDLWHEVGTYIFFDQLDDFRRGFDLNRPHDEQLYREMGDHFGDLVVCIYGFDCDFRQFAVSLLQGWCESQAAHVPKDVRAKMLAGVVLRLMFVYDVLAFHREPLKENTEWELKQTIEGIVNEYFAGDRRLAFEPLTWGRAFTAWNYSAAYRHHFDRLRQCVDSRHIFSRLARAPEATVEFSNELIAFAPDQNVNSVLRQLFWFIQETRKGHGGKASNIFGEMAAVGRSAVLEYHRRLATIIIDASPGVFVSPEDEPRLEV